MLWCLADMAPDKKHISYKPTLNSIHFLRRTRLGCIKSSLMEGVCLDWRRTSCPFPSGASVCVAVCLGVKVRIFSIWQSNLIVSE